MDVSSSVQAPNGHALRHAHRHAERHENRTSRRESVENAHGRGHVHSNDRAHARGQVAERQANRAEARENFEPSIRERRVKGVIGLLEAGHFKAVAAIRLRINFHAELSARRTSEAANEIESSAADLTTAVADVLASASEGMDEAERQLAASAQETFTTSVDEVVSGFRSGELNQTAALAAFQMTFDELIGALNPPVKEEEEEAPDSQPAYDESAADTGETAAPVTEAPVVSAVPEVVIANSPQMANLSIGTAVEAASVLAMGSTTEQLEELFGGFLEEVESSLEELTAMPQFAQHRGHGVAFEKFMTMYRSLMEPGAESSNATPDQESPTVDQLA